MNTMLPRISLFLFLLTIPLTACQAPPPANPGPSPEAATATLVEPVVTNPPAPTVPGVSTPTQILPTPEPEIQLSRYRLFAVLDYVAHHLQVEQSIRFVNNTGESLDEVLLLVEPNRYPGGFALKELKWVEGPALGDYSLDGVELRLPLQESLPSGGTMEVALSYELTLPNQQAPYGYTNRQANLGDWYPYAPPYVVGEGWLVREDAYYGEHLAYDKADFEVEIRLTQPQTAAGEPLSIAASALPEISGDTHRYELLNARNFAWSVSHLYQMQETMVGDITVRSYSFPFHPAADGPALESTAQALALFSKLFSPYPHQSLSVVEADFLDGMEFDGMFFLSHAFYDYYTGDQRSNLVMIAAHETSHQWWYGLVGNDQANEPWLDEALTTYSESLFYEHQYPDLLDWWWENRIRFWDPQGWVDETIYQASGFYPYRNSVYLRGAMFLGELRSLMGDEAFLAFLHDYLGRYTDRQATADDFFEVLSEHTSADLAPLLQQYFAKR